MTVVSVDQYRAEQARQEEDKEPDFIEFKGTNFQLPRKLPISFTIACEQLGTRGTAKAIMKILTVLFGEEVALANIDDITDDDISFLLREVPPLYKVNSGESSGLPVPSTSTSQP